MSLASGEEVAAVLLRALPADLTEQLLGRIGGEPAQRLRACLQSLSSNPVDMEQIRNALREFNDLKRISERSGATAAATGEYRPVAPKPKPDANLDPINALRELELPRLVRVLQHEQASTVSLVMTCLDGPVATEVMKRLPAKLRPDVAIRLAQARIRNQPLLEQIARAVFQKAEKLADVVPELTAADRDKNLADMLCALNRAERKEIMEAL